mmetsp:Transcript_27563/g.64636  ORF Transcript_27563/g.64636 Transcript_27563/m.64636 type:complete len:276 (-) Transcript_27563:78-905(-)
MLESSIFSFSPLVNSFSISLGDSPSFALCPSSPSLSLPILRILSLAFFTTLRGPSNSVPRRAYPPNMAIDANGGGRVGIKTTPTPMRAPPPTATALFLATLATDEPLRSRVLLSLPSSSGSSLHHGEGSAFFFFFFFFLGDTTEEVRVVSSFPSSSRRDLLVLTPSGVRSIASMKPSSRDLPILLRSLSTSERKDLNKDLFFFTFLDLESSDGTSSAGCWSWPSCFTEAKNCAPSAAASDGATASSMAISSALGGMANCNMYVDGNELEDGSLVF